MAKANIPDAANVLKTTEGKAAVDKLGTWLAADGKGLVTALRPAFKVFHPDHAEALYGMACEIAVKKGGKARAAATPQRISNTKAMLLAAQNYACFDKFMDNVDKLNPAWETLVSLCGWLRSKDLAFDKKSDTPPSTEQIETFLSDRKARDKTKKSALKGQAKVEADQPAAVASVIETVGFLALIEGTGAGGSFLKAAVDAMVSYQKHVKARATEEAAVIAKALAAHRASVK